MPSTMSSILHWTIGLSQRKKTRKRTKIKNEGIKNLFTYIENPKESIGGEGAGVKIRESIRWLNETSSTKISSVLIYQFKSIKICNRKIKD